VTVGLLGSPVRATVEGPSRPQDGGVETLGDLCGIAAAIGLAWLLGWRTGFNQREAAKHAKRPSSLWPESLDPDREVSLGLWVRPRRVHKGEEG